jgi:uncharacterized coiled-coil DUF342 family protein
MDNEIKILLDNINEKQERQEKRIDNMELENKGRDGIINDLKSSMLLMTEQMKQMKESMDKFIKTVEDMKNKPNETLDKVKIGVITAICSGLATSMITAILILVFKNK